MWVISIRPLKGQATRSQQTFDDMDDALDSYLEQIVRAIKVSDDCCSPLYRDFVENGEETHDAFREYLLGDSRRNVPPVQVLKEIIPVLGVQWLMTLAKEQA